MVAIEEPSFDQDHRFRGRPKGAKRKHQSTTSSKREPSGFEYQENVAKTRKGPKKKVKILEPKVCSFFFKKKSISKIKYIYYKQEKKKRGRPRKTNIQEESEESEVSFNHIKYILIIEFYFFFSRQRKPVMRNQKENSHRIYLKRHLRNPLRKKKFMILLRL